MTDDDRVTSPAGMLHELVLFQGFDEMLELVGPRVRSAMRHGTPVIVAAPPEAVRAVRERFGDGVLSLPSADGARRPAAELAEIESALAGDAEARRVCFLTQPSVRAASWPDRRRAEAAVNLLLEGRSVDYLCAYERRELTKEMLAQLVEAHPLDLPSVGALASARAALLDGLLDRWFDTPRTALESTPPDLLLVDPRPVDARRAIAASCGGIRIDADALVLATSEMLTNAVVHGLPPVTLRVWKGAERVVVTVNDRGPGPGDLLHGLWPRRGDLGAGGLGAWIAHQLVDVRQRRDADGYTVVLSLESVPVGA